AVEVDRHRPAGLCLGVLAIERADRREVLRAGADEGGREAAGLLELPRLLFLRVDGFLLPCRGASCRCGGGCCREGTVQRPRLLERRRPCDPAIVVRLVALTEGEPPPLAGRTHRRTGLEPDEAAGRGIDDGAQQLGRVDTAIL